jgi:prepilin-type N-terminal cleavage/methylation domain-containing protein
LKKAFSLIELMIVIVIMGVVYTLIITKLHTIDEQKAPFSLKNMKEKLIKIAKKSGTDVRLWCFEDCSTCKVYVDKKPFQDVQGFVDDDVHFYRYDYLQGVTDKRQDVLFDANGVAQDICFSFGVESSGVSDQVLIVSKGKAYDYTHYLEGVVVYDSLEELIAAKEKLIEEVK